jgi:hypothetical protein
MKTSINNFNFQLTGYGHYSVTYTSPKTGKSWKRTTTDMQLIDATNNSDTPTQKSLNQLKSFVKK